MRIEDNFIQFESFYLRLFICLLIFEPDSSNETTGVD